jgi:hypothetical protein
MMYNTLMLYETLLRRGAQEGVSPKEASDLMVGTAALSVIQIFFYFNAVLLKTSNVVSQASVHQKAVWVISLMPPGREYETCMLLSAIALSTTYVNALAHVMRYLDYRLLFAYMRKDGLIFL